jgi:hypothetical protein
MINSPFAFLSGTGDREKVEKMFAERERLYQHNLQRLGDIDRLKEKNEILSEEVKMKEELIPGMEKMIAHIKKLAEENKDLKNKVDAIPELLEEERYKERACNERDMEDKDDELQAEIDELKEENNKLKLMISRLPNDMEDKWWCENNQRWRWFEDGYEEGEETEEESEEESEEEEDKCEECGKFLEGEDKCEEGCPAYDKGWAEATDK